MKTHLVPGLVVAFSLCASATAATVPLLDLDFSGFADGPYLNNSTIGSGGNSATVRTVVGSTLAVAGGTLNLSRATAGSANPFGLHTAISDGAAYETLSASFTFTLNALGPTLRFTIDSNSAFPSSPSASTQAVSIWVNSGGNLRYTSGGTNFNTPGDGGDLVLATGRQYRLDFTADFTSPTQDTWSFSLHDVSAGTVIYSSGFLNTRAANIVPGSLAIVGIDAASSGNPFVSFSELHLSGTTPIPEPASGALALGAGALLCALRRRRR